MPMPVANMMLNPDVLLRSSVSDAMVGEKQMGQQHSAIPVANASAICAGSHRISTRAMQIRGAVMNENNSNGRKPKRRARNVTGNVATTLPRVSEATMFPTACSLKCRSVR